MRPNLRGIRRITYITIGDMEVIVDRMLVPKLDQSVAYRESEDLH